MGELLDVGERPDRRHTQLDCEGRPVTAATAVRPSNRRAGFMVKLGVVLAVLGGGLGVYAGTGLWSFFGDLVFNPEHDVPGTFSQDLEAGDHLLSVQTSSSTGGPISFTSFESVDVSALTITDPNGVDVPFRSGANQTVERNGTGFSGVAVFTVTEPGSYRVDITTSRETTALITPSLNASRFVAFALGTLAGLGFVAGVILVVVGIVLGRRQDPPATPPSSGPVQPPAAPQRPSPQQQPGWAPPPPPQSSPPPPPPLPPVSGYG